MMRLFRKNYAASIIAQQEKGYKNWELYFRYGHYLSRKFSNGKIRGIKNRMQDIDKAKWERNLNTKYKENRNRKPNVLLDETSNEEDPRDIYFNNKLIERKIADIMTKKSHNELLFEYLPMEGRTNNVPKGFKISQYLFLFVISSGVLLIHILPEIDKENYIRDIFSLEIYSCSCFLVFHGGFNSLLQLIQYGIPPKRKYKGLYNSLRFISSIIPLFFGLITASLCENFPRDSIFLLIISYMSLLLNYYLLHTKCLTPAWMFRQCKILICFIIFNLLLLLISEAQIYRGRKVSMQLDD
ncbi:hypothetical protein, conserved [Plasmodium gonderi]|uniref:Uncharacterized protein n=1 Tax=Plasmodium gonderi TaxID=77519 RepID=A0A1Y1JSZ1_PLAGO|nr:hypothetical protein, conserved [Plasmodium gonderi]GAW83543.1 hypothetical protein, conserved [Plasmodium gonderi]